jgi:hypothetical protein
MVLKGYINGLPSKFLLYTGASGTAFIKRQFCIDESNRLTPAKVGITVILVDYPLILGCPWLNHHVAEISFQESK